jgi:hypothetical protein
MNNFIIDMQKHIKSMTDDELFYTSANNLWDVYLESFAPEHRQYYNCSACRKFIKQFGGVVSIRDNKKVSIWDFNTTEKCAKALSARVHECSICGLFTTKSRFIGKPNHLHVVLPEKYVGLVSDRHTYAYQFWGLLEGIEISTIKNMLNMIEINKGKNKSLLISLLFHKKAYDLCKNKDLYAWEHKDPDISRIINTKIKDYLFFLQENKSCLG